MTPIPATAAMPRHDQTKPQRSAAASPPAPASPVTTRLRIAVGIVTPKAWAKWRVVSSMPEATPRKSSGRAPMTTVLFTASSTPVPSPVKSPTASIAA